MPEEDPRERLAAFIADWQLRRDAHDEEGTQLLAERDAAMREAYAAGLIQTDIASIVGLSQQFVSRVVKRRPS